MDKSDKKLLETAKKRFKKAHEFWSPIYEKGRDDVKFAFGEQWDESVKKRRQQEGRPCLTVNRVLASVRQVTNDIRQTRPAINVRPVDDNSDVETAQIYQGLIRNIESVSNADTAYDSASFNAITAGIGWLRVSTDYADYDSFDQEIKIERVLNYESVLLDPNTKAMDGSDAEYGFVFDDMSRSDFEETYPDADPVSFDEYKDGEWAKQDTIRIAEYFYKIYEYKVLALTSEGTMPEDEAKEKGLEVIQTRKSKVCKVKWCKLTGAEILEKTDWMGMYIPIIPVYGDEVVIEGKREFQSLIRNAKDPQRMVNFWTSASAEVIAYQPKAPFIALEGQISGADSKKWQNANNESFSVLTYKPVDLGGGQIYAQAPQRQMPPQGSIAMLQERNVAIDDIKASLGIFDASLGARGNETSGKAILARQVEGDNATFHFVDNLSTSIRHLGRIIVDLIRKVYTEPQVIRILGEDDKPVNVPINQVAVKAGKNYYPIKSGKQGEKVMLNLGDGKYDVICSMGASYASKRQEAAAAMVELTRAVPEFGRVAGDLMVKAMDFPDADKIAERIKKTMPPEIVGGEDEQNPEQAMVMQAQAQIMELNNQIAQMQQALEAKAVNEEQKTAIEAQKLQLEEQKIAIESAKLELDKVIADQKHMEAMAKLELEATKSTQNDVMGAFDTVQRVTNGLAGVDGIQSILQEIAGIKNALTDTAQAVDMVMERIEMDDDEKENEPEEEDKITPVIEKLAVAVEQLNKPKKKKVIRDKSGNVTGMVEE